MNKKPFPGNNFDIIPCAFNRTPGFMLHKKYQTKTYLYLTIRITGVMINDDKLINQFERRRRSTPLIKTAF